ncbi:hypothetical protein AA904_05740 [Geobacillus stearothermophilus]|uniref:Uncharacterized protein n=1 Tax=Geobacillus stearothermophilus TaxID=1422 RepID=A0A3L7DDF9_GEOSE|nr:hypothetical protein [Geobacillus stearothermophilus]PJW14917.1 hypothetical protein CV945_05880 [Geobacillus sp. Manikaran-105]PJW17870.1 hypothetical protein CV944_06520 [Geobacillus sp. WSUCF-018B]KMY62339.1 hypothetical protein AA904_05740 [Geobacillus stearothermophilus]KMY63512.1 hypothetical protein AA905_05400 [Geobacillus stearothermophilus]MED4979118.1 hypothetical protein [Geobacillus stearothermophilus]
MCEKKERRYKVFLVEKRSEKAVVLANHRPSNKMMKRWGGSKKRQPSIGKESGGKKGFPMESRCGLTLFFTTYRPSKEKDKAKSDNIKDPQRVIESIDNVFRQHSRGNSDKFFRKGKRFDKFGQPHISGPFHKEVRKRM